MTNNKLNQTPLAATIAKGQMDSTAATQEDSVIHNAADSEKKKPSLREGSTLYYATLRLDEADRNRTLNALEFIQTLSTCLNGVQEPSVAQTKLQWWSDEINRLALNEPRHPVTQRCAPDLAGNETVQQHLSTILDAATAARFDTPDNTETWHELVQRDYTARLAVVLSALGEHEGLSQTSLDVFAPAVGWVDILSSLPRRVHHDSIALPPSLYEQFNLSLNDLRLHLRVEGRAAPSPENQRAVQAILNAAINQATTQMAQAIQNPAYKTLQQNKKLKAFATWLQIRHAQLGLWQKSQPDLLRETLTLTPLRKWYIAFKHR